MTLSISNELKRKLNAHPEVRWSSVVRSIIEQKLSALERSEKLVKDSQFTVADANFFAEKLNKEMGTHAEALLHEHYRRR